MAYDEGLAQRIRELLEERAGLSERKMFGGLCFLLDGHMIAGPMGSELMVRVGPEAWADALTRPHAREMDFTGRSMKGFVFVGEDGVAEDGDLRGWLDLAIHHAGSLPSKKKASPKKKAPSRKKASSKKKQASSKKKASPGNKARRAGR